MATGYTEQELARLSEAERQAVMDLEEDERENERLKNGGSEDDGEAARLLAEKTAREEAEAAARAKKDAEEKEKADAADAEQKAKEEGDGKPGTEAEKTASAPADTTAIEAPKPLFEAQPVEDYDKKLADLKTQKAAITKKVEDGDLTFGEAEVEREKLNDQEFELKLQQREYELAQKTQKQQTKNAWQSECDAFLESNSEYTSPGRFKLLNDHVIVLAKDPANLKLTGAQLLQKAHEAVEADIGPSPTKKAVKKEEKKGVELPDTPTLNRIPAAEANEASENRFANLDKLTGEEYETALRKLSPSEYDAYMKA